MRTTDGWLKLDLESCVIRQTRSLGVLVLCSICNIVVIVDYTFGKGSLAGLCVMTMRNDSLLVYLYIYHYYYPCHPTMYSMSFKIDHSVPQKKKTTETKRSSLRKFYSVLYMLPA